MSTTLDRLQKQDAELDRYERRVMRFDDLMQLVPPEEMPPEVRMLLERQLPPPLPSLSMGQVMEITTRLRKPAMAIKTALPLICVGDGGEVTDPCVYVPGCPLVQAGIAPVGHPCPFETQLVDSLFGFYTADLDVKPTNILELSQVKDLVMLDLLIHRATGMVARDGLVDLNPIGSSNGMPYADEPVKPEVLYRRDLSAAADLIDRLTTRKQQILKSMLATREMQEKYKKRPKSDLAASLEALLKKAHTKAIE